MQPDDDNGPQPVTFLVTAQRTDGAPATIEYRTLAGIAVEGVDYTAVSGTLTIDLDARPFAEVDVDVLANADNHDASKSFFLQFFYPTTGHLLGQAKCVISN